MSGPARGLWIEMMIAIVQMGYVKVGPRKGPVD